MATSLVRQHRGKFLFRLRDRTGQWVEVALPAKDMADAEARGARLAAIAEGIRLGIPPPIDSPTSASVYFAAAKRDDLVLVKIGFARDVRKRIQQLQTGAAAPIALIAWRHGGAVEEREEHQRWHAHRDHGEWFRLDGAFKAYLTAVRERLVAE